MKKHLLLTVVLTAYLLNLGKTQELSSHTKIGEKHLVETQSKIQPIFAYVATEYKYRFGKAEDDYKFLFKIKEKKHNIANKFTGINLEKDGQDGGVATFSGVIHIIVQYKKQAYIVSMYLRYKNVFTIRHAKKLSNGNYESIDDNKREDIILPALYSRLEYLFYEDNRFKKSIKSIEKAEQERGKPYVSYPK